MRRTAMLGCAAMLLASSAGLRGTPAPIQLPDGGVSTQAQVGNPRIERRTTRSARRVGFATFYARRFEGRLTASGTRFDNDALVAAHPTLPFGTLLRVTNISNGRSVEVRVVDRGPARRARANGVIIDLSRAAASALDFVEAGRTRVRLDVLERGAT